MAKYDLQQSKVAEISACLLNGGVALLPTDTVYGLAVHPTFHAAIDRLYALKERPRQLKLPIMVASIDELALLGVTINKTMRQLVESPFVPGALTMAVGFENKPLVAWLEGREEIAIRIPDDEQLLAVLRQTGPLFVTSANRTGAGETPDQTEAILAQLNGTPDLVVDRGTIKTIPSTLVNCRKNPPVIERIGVIAEAELLPYLEFKQ